MPAESINEHSLLHGKLEARLSEVEEKVTTDAKTMARIHWILVISLIGIIGNLIISWPK